MHVEDAAIIELEQLMLSATDDSRHGGTAQRAQAMRRDAPPQRRMNQRDAANGLSEGRLAKDAGRSLDFGKLGHTGFAGV